ncbi:hypothetical protein GWO43_07550, partial [candidate division KSB1 bacterium]|nr:hypothetical protein [candidate division KSB1 bacterium]NIR73034.1 hypothetical protein [candidate division KSB1 bacterium]NIS23814.1 hypothetical protein [candidate division KSB1 bacterium]NIT70741.1 hypothetical protein [candidate division KSB1 bacterium]NIU24463.1 hypothetical protein [candidate division KSB1 bacterium]
MQTLQPIHEITSLTSSFMPAQIVLTANRLDLFTQLDGKRMSGKELAKELKTNARATELLC